jgi:hypothetical protein
MGIIQVNMFLTRFKSYHYKGSALLDKSIINADEVAVYEIGKQPSLSSELRSPRSGSGSPAANHFCLSLQLIQLLRLKSILLHCRQSFFKHRKNIFL